MSVSRSGSARHASDVRLDQPAAPPRSTPLLWTPFDVLVLTKLTPPRPGARSVPRARLIAQLDAALESQATLLQAPAGYGKTTLMAQWLDQRPEHIAWVSLDAGESRPDSFMAYLLAALQRVHNDLGMHARKELFEQGGAGVDTALKLLLNELSFFPEPVIIVLDDFHAAGSEPVNALMNQLCEHLPESVHLVIVSRSDTGLHLSRLRVGGKLTLIGADELAFDEQEVSAFVAGNFPEALGPDAAALVAARAQGWAAGLRMAAIALADAPPERSASILSRMPGENHLIEDFLVEEVLGTQSAEVVDFLIQIAVLEQVHASLAEAVTGNPESGRLLESIARAQLFITRLDGGEWHRFHQLLLDVLRKRAGQQLGREGVQALHRRAADWHVANQQPSDAVAHALAAEDWELASRLIKPVFTRLLQSERPWDLYSWIERLPPQLYENDPALASGYAWAMNRLGVYDRIPPVLDEVARMLAQRPDPVMEAVVAEIKAGVARGRSQSEQIIVHAEQALTHLEGAFAKTREIARVPQFDGPTPLQAFNDSLLWTAKMQVGAGLVRAGKPREAEQILAEVRADMTARSRTIILSPHAEEVSALLLQGRLCAAKRVVDDARRATGGRKDLTDYRLLLIVEADLLREWNRLDDARDLLELAGQLSRAGRFRTFLPELYTTRARVHAAAGDYADAVLELDSALAAADELGSERLAQEAVAYRTRLAIMSGDLALVRDWALRGRLTAESEILPESIVALFTFARVLIADAEPDDAIRLLERLRAAAEVDGRGQEVIEALLLQAIAYQDLFELDAAAGALDRALQLSRLEGHTRLYLDEGRAMTRLLRAALHREVQPREVRRLLAAAGVDVSGIAVSHPDLAEPLTPREIDVLKLIAVGLSNREISDELYISVATVKRHITNVYGKLGCTSRTLAVERARALELF